MLELFEQRVDNIYMSNDQTFIIFVLWGGGDIIRFDTYAECCSETWFADIIGAENVLGETVIGIRRLDLPEPTDNRSRQEEDYAYGLRLSTRKGDCDFIYRNSSNGYYGGSLEKGVMISELPQDCFEIKTDYSA